MAQIDKNVKSDLNSRERIRLASEARKQEMLKKAEEHTARKDPCFAALLHSVMLETFQTMELPERAWQIDPLIRTAQIVMIYARAGVGKTWFTLQLALGMTRPGKIFGPFTSTGDYNVFYLDGEMAAKEMQDRINSLAIEYEPTRFVLCSSELLALQNQPIPNLIDPKWLDALESYLKRKKFDVFVIDNLSSLTPGQDEQKRIDWDQINQWLIGLRRLGITVILIHHAGKGGDQRGTSSREDQIDLSLRLSRLDNRDNTVFRVDFAKARGLRGEQKRPFIVELLENPEGKIIFQHKSINDDILARIIFMASRGINQRDIAKTLSLNQSSVSRRLDRACKEGLLVTSGSGRNKSYTLTETGEALTSGMRDDDI